MARKQLIGSVVFGLMAFVLWAACVPLLAWGCGESLSAVFTYGRGPDYPLDGFAQGSLGILTPDFARSYLYAAYRYLSGRPFDAAEQNALLRLWDERLGGSSHDAAKPWLEARRAVPGSKPVDIDVFTPVPGHDFDFFLNITPDAFRVAAQTLTDRIEKFGADSKLVADWLAAQDMVFCSVDRENEGEFGHTEVGFSGIPDLPAPGLPPLARADRIYQRASAYFYVGNYDQALQAYRQISSDGSSPWSATSKFMIPRCLLRKATLGTDQGIDPALAALAEAELKSVLTDPALKEFHQSASRLLAYVAFRLRPEQRLEELEETLSRGSQGDAIFQELWDYTDLLDMFFEREYEEGSRVARVEKKRSAEDLARPKPIARDDMTDWIVTFQSGSSKALDYSLMKWRGTGSLPWLVSCLAKMRVGHPGLNEVLLAAEKVPADSSAFATVSFHRSRLLVESGDKDKARKIVDEVLSHRESLAESSLNLFLAERMALAQTLNDFLVYAPRRPTAVGYFTGDNSDIAEGITDLKQYREGDRLIDADGAAVMNRGFSLDVLTTVATSEKLDPHLRRQIAMAAWTRAVLLGRSRNGTQLAAVLGRLVPEIRKEDLQAYIRAKGDEAQRFAATYILLKTPGLTPIIGAGLPREAPADEVGFYSDGRWWCAQPSFQYVWSYGDSILRAEAAIFNPPLRLLYPEGKVPPPAFLSQGEKRAASEEWQALSAVDNAANFMCRQVLAWAQRHPDDPRVPEALHLAVRATRYGCTDYYTSELSKKAFQMLHRKYPKSEWAAKTKYWF